jgi:hypothetical protein
MSGWTQRGTHSLPQVYMAHVLSGIQSTTSQVYRGGGVPTQPKMALAPPGQVALLVLLMLLSSSCCRRLLLLPWSMRVVAVFGPFRGCIVLWALMPDLASLLLLHRPSSSSRRNARGMLAVSSFSLSIKIYLCWRRAVKQVSKLLYSMGKFHLAHGCSESRLQQVRTPLCCLLSAACKLSNAVARLSLRTVGN